MTSLDVVSHIQRLRRYARFLCRDAADADDLVQETLVKALSKADQFQPGSNLRVWLFSILHNAFISGTRAFERRRRMSAQQEQTSSVGVPAPQEMRIELRRVLRALDRLSEDQRRVILLVAVDGMTTDEAALVLGLPVGTVRSRLARGREALRRISRGRESEAEASPLRLVGGHDVQAR